LKQTLSGLNGGRKLIQIGIKRFGLGTTRRISILLRRYMKHYWLRKWRKKLGIKDEIRAEYVPKENVVNEYKRPYHLVGICDNRILHDRRLKEEDVIHELLHFKHPRYKESTIRRMTWQHVEAQASVKNKRGR
jgi:hypothetical protein